MKTIILFCFVMVIGMSSCGDSGQLEENKKTKSQDVRKIAWEYLESKQWTGSITHTYQEAIVDSSLWENKKSITVLFNTKDDALLGPIVVHINPETLEVLGISPRD